MNRGREDCWLQCDKIPQVKPITHDAKNEKKYLSVKFFYSCQLFIVAVALTRHMFETFFRNPTCYK